MLSFSLMFALSVHCATVSHTNFVPTVVLLCCRRRRRPSAAAFESPNPRLPSAASSSPPLSFLLLSFLLIPSVMTNPQTGESNLLKFLALGRLARGSSAGAVAARAAAESALNPEKEQPLGKHQVLAYASASKDEKTKIYKDHVKDVMKKGASKLAGGKRVRLISDETNEKDGDGGGGEEGKYELHILTEYINDDPNLALVFFAITAPDFGKHQNISGMFKDFKNGVYEQFDKDTLSNAQSNSGVHNALKPYLDQMFHKYNKSALANATRKVEQVKDIMKDNVNRALNNVEVLEEMEVKAESMENQAKIFEKRSSNVLWLMRCRYIKVTIVIGLLIAALLAYLIWYIYSRTHVYDGPAPPPAGSGGGSNTGTGTGGSL